MHDMKNISFEALDNKLTAAGQRHLLRFWSQLDQTGRQRLAAAIMDIDWEQVARMQSLMTDNGSDADGGEVAPATVAQIDDSEAKLSEEQGRAALAAGKTAVLLVAGGQGSRLGFDGPKGAFPVGPVSHASLFEIHARKVLALEVKHRARIPFLVMTSRANDAATREFFEQNDYFGLSPERVWFFTQGMLPAMLPDGRLILEAPDRLFLAPDGHGGVLAALQRAGLLEKLQAYRVETVFYFQVDNPLVRIADPVFIGFHRRQRAQMSLKVCMKRSPDEGLGVVGVRNGRNIIIEYTELTEDQKQARDQDGTLRFGYGSVAIHVFSLDFLVQQAGQSLPLHRAYKKIPVCDDQGRTQMPASPNGFKFERFIFDVLPRAERVAVVPFKREHEFSPVKNATGEDSPASARRAMICRFADCLQEAGVDVPRYADGIPRIAIEIDPLYAADTLELRRKLSPKFSLNGDVYLR